jgi:hypothetical protein
MKYYYTDPLAAAWMAKQHGMRFENIDLPDDLKRNEAPVSSLDDAGYGDGKIYIHPDSAHLLEPQVGDLWAGMGKDAHYCVWYITDVEAAERLKLNTDNLLSRMIPYSRNGIAFMWPEVEC